MSTTSYPAQEHVSEISMQHVASRPDLASLSNDALVARARELAGPGLEAAWTEYCQSALGVSLGPGAVQAICAAIGRAGDAVKLLTAVGSIESAGRARCRCGRCRGRSRTRRRSRQPSTPASTDSSNAWPSSMIRLQRPSSRSGTTSSRRTATVVPNEWDLRAHSWTTRPSMPLGMLERMRFQDDSKSPIEAQARGAAEREALTAELLGLLEGDAEAHGTLAAGISSAAFFSSMREMGKNACIRLIHEAKLALMELGRRMVAEGVIDDPQQIFMLLDDEIDGFLDDPASMSATLRDRDVAFHHLQTLEPPYIVKLEDGVAPISTWPVRGGHGAAVASAGDVLQGAMGSPGVVTGVARIVLDPSDAGAIGPGDIMVAPTTDPSWVPLFLSAEGVVVNVGAVASHAAIMCRELGLPCAVSVIDATERIPDGAVIEIDGSTGTVTIISVP